MQGRQAAPTGRRKKLSSGATKKQKAQSNWAFLNGA
jgi:hypothetical protein